MSLEEKLPEGTVVITDISQLSNESQELFAYYKWTLGTFQDIYHSAVVIGQRLKMDKDGSLVRTKDGYAVDRDIEAVLKEKVQTGKDGVTPQKMAEMLAAVAVRYFELLAKKAPVSINGTTKKEWGLFLNPPTNKSYEQLYLGLARQYAGHTSTPSQTK